MFYATLNVNLLFKQHSNSKNTYKHLARELSTQNEVKHKDCTYISTIVDINLCEDGCWNKTTLAHIPIDIDVDVYLLNHLDRQKMKTFPII